VSRLPDAPAGWHYGTVLVDRRRRHTVMFLRMAAYSEASQFGVAAFYGMTIKTDRLGVESGRLFRVDFYPVTGWWPE
jgi:hypothetical protein